MLTPNELAQKLDDKLSKMSRKEQIKYIEEFGFTITNKPATKKRVNPKKTSNTFMKSPVVSNKHQNVTERKKLVAKAKNSQISVKKVHEK